MKVKDRKLKSCLFLMTLSTDLEQRFLKLRFNLKLETRKMSN